MSAAEESDTMQHCASCGTAGGDDINIKLKRCNGCYLVRYCSVKCQKEHWPKHKRECKKRAAELKDEILFKQPECSSYGDCPICCLPLQIDPENSTLYSCCSKKICNGCNIAKAMREREGRLQHKCPFCRKAVPETEEEARGLLMKRVQANDTAAIFHMGIIRYHARDYEAAFEYLTRAVALGNVAAHFQLSLMYHDGKGVEKDEKKEQHHAEKAAIAGHPIARHNLACFEARNGQYNIARRGRAVKHYIIAAKLGHDGSLECLKELHKAGQLSRDDFSAALRGYQAANDATKSPQREEAAEFARQAADRRRGVQLPLIQLSTL